MVEEEKSAELSPARQPGLGRWARLPPGVPIVQRAGHGGENRAGPMKGLHPAAGFVSAAGPGYHGDCLIVAGLSWCLIKWEGYS